MTRATPVPMQLLLRRNNRKAPHRSRSPYGLPLGIAEHTEPPREENPRLRYDTEPYNAVLFRKMGVKYTHLANLTEKLYNFVNCT